MTLKHFTRTAPLFLMVAIGIAASAALFTTVQHLERARAKARFLQVADQRLDAVRVKVSCALCTVNLFRSYFSASPKSAFDRRGFKTFVAPALAKQGCIRALEWIPRVTRKERPRYERLARTDGVRNFAFRQRTANGVMAVAGPRDQYFPVFYVEPLAGNEPAVGFDLASEQVHLAALNKARDTGELTATAPVELVLDKSRQLGMLVFVPVYRSPQANSISARRESFVGFALGVFRIGDLVSTMDMDSKS